MTVHQSHDSHVTTEPPHTQACADKLQREMEDFGFPPDFPEEDEDETSSKKARCSKRSTKLSTYPKAVLVQHIDATPYQ